MVNKEKITTILYKFLESSGYLAYLTAEEGKIFEKSRSIHYLQQFFEYISKFEETVVDNNVFKFVEHLRLVMESGDEGSLSEISETPDSVNIMTVHTAKGLEFKYVFVVNLVEERFPTRRRGEAIEIPLELINEKLPSSDSHYEEERRLFYVAVTRAKEKLFLCSAKDYGGVKIKKESRFVVESEIEKKVGDSSGSLVFESTMQNDSTQESIYLLPEVFSFSQIKSYEGCPYQYKLAHVFKLPTKSNPSFSFGTSLHRTLQKFYLKVQEINSLEQGSLFNEPRKKNSSGKIGFPDYEELIKFYEDSWISDWFLSKKQQDEYFTKGKEILKMFYETETNRIVPLFLEEGFKIKIGNFAVNGRIDRVDQLPDGSLEIIDYKTGQPKDKLTFEDKQQLLIYQLVCDNLPTFRNIGKVSRLSYYYLDNNTKISFIGNQEELAKIRELVENIIVNIKSRNFLPTPGQFVCRYCDFFEICNYRSKK